MRVVSVIDREAFIKQPKEIQAAIVAPKSRVVAAEAGISMGWEYFAKPEDIFAINRFGESGPAAKVAEHLGFTAENLAKIIAK